MFVLIAVIAAVGASTTKPAQKSTTTAAVGTTTTTEVVATTTTSSTAATSTTSTTLSPVAIVAAAGADSPGQPIVTAAEPAAQAGIVTQDMTLTPGVVSAAVTQANVQSTICVSGYTASVRNVTDATKQKVFAEYGIANPPSGAYEVDHLIPLELGGSNDIRNLWPEAYAGADNARDKDTWENRLKSQVCAGTTTLIVAQDEIVHWWVLLGAAASPGAAPVATASAAPIASVTPAAPAVPGAIKPGAFCSPEGATGTYNGLNYVCASTSATGVPYKSGTLHWRQG